MTGRCLGLMGRRLGLIGLALFFSFGAAQAGDSDMANPPDIVATTNCASGFADYRRALHPLYFALSQDGKHCSYSFCQGGCRKSNVRGQTLIACQRSSRAGPCEIYAYGGAVNATRDIKLAD